MGRRNPDVAVFMHAARITHLTNPQYRMELRYIVRGPTEVGQGDEMVVFDHQSLGLGNSFRFVDELPEPYKWPVLPDLERLAYDPRTIVDELVPHDEAADSMYQNMQSSDLEALLRRSRSYLSQFDTPQGDQSLSRYALMLAPIDDQKQPEPWFQTPLFTAFGPGNRIQLLQYTRWDRRAATLDRLMYRATVAPSGKVLLIPVAIVRPLSVIPAVQFKTVYMVPDQVNSGFYVQFKHFTPSLNRPNADRVRADPASAGFLFGLPRPLGHPLSILESGGEAKIPTGRIIPEMQASSAKVEPVELQPVQLSHAPPPTMPPAAPQHRYRFAYKPGQPNPYEHPQEDPMDVLMAHFKPKLEDMWHYPKP